VTFEERIEALRVRHEALTMNLELMGHDIEGLKTTSERLLILAQQDGENIRALARIADMHDRRLTSLEGSQE
jgi:hypothetical protein